MIDYPKKNIWVFWTPIKQTWMNESPPFIKNQWSHKAHDRWISQFSLYCNKDLDELVNLIPEEIERKIYDFILEQRQTYTESTVSQKISAILSFFSINDIGFLSNRIINQFTKTPLWNIDDYNVIFKK